MESQSKSKDRVRAVVGFIAGVQAVVGLALLFAGREVTAVALSAPAPEPLPSLLGAAYLGFAAMNWIARHNVLGGIYGRAVVAANQTHFVIGALTLAKPLLTWSATAPVMMIGVAYAVGALYFIRLSASTGLRPADSGERP